MQRRPNRFVPESLQLALQHRLHPSDRSHGQLSRESHLSLVHSRNRNLSDKASADSSLSFDP